MTKKKLTTIFLIFVLCGIFGFIYEMLFYRIDLGYFVKRGSTFGPWIPIYGFGALLIYFIAGKFKNKPILVFLVSLVVSGLLELISGFILLKAFHLRLWNYYEEILNFGNIGGFVCLRSILTFGLFGLLLIYLITPLIEKIILKDKKNILFIISLLLTIIFILDNIIFWIIIKA
ncbi:MAG: putative ABC transporter permease [Bacilli bacterium]|nr:putative ABC transporter permease [Bacilli bacterium]